MVITKGDVANAGSFLALPKRHRTIGFVSLRRSDWGALPYASLDRKDLSVLAGGASR